MAHEFLRHVVADWEGCRASDVQVDHRCPTCAGGHGRPLVTIGGRPGPSVSLARAAGLVAVAVAGATVGIDVEPIHRGWPGVSSVALSPRERTALEGSARGARDAAALRVWVRKEAVLKATGHGLQVDPGRMEITGDPMRLGRWDGPGRRRAVAVADVDAAPGYLVSVACLGRRRLVLDAAPGFRRA